jgi:threonine dehydrogenase-like Zn-dependent dehydrogenase
MKIFDCTSFYSEHMMYEVRLNILDDKVDKFIVTESTYSHSGKKKKLNFDIIFDSVGLEVSRQQAIEIVSPGGSIIHIGLTQPAGTFNFRKLTLQEITLVGTYCYTNKDFQQTINLLHKKTLGPLEWIEYRELKNGANAFKEIHDGTCVAPKIVLIP